MICGDCDFFILTVTIIIIKYYNLVLLWFCEMCNVTTIQFNYKMLNVELKMFQRQIKYDMQMLYKLKPCTD